jgi:hypothetical protein
VGHNDVNGKNAELGKVNFAKINSVKAKTLIYSFQSLGKVYSVTVQLSLGSVFDSIRGYTLMTGLLALY